MTVAEFLAWDANDPTGPRWQLIDGQPVAMAPALGNACRLAGGDRPPDRQSSAGKRQFLPVARSAWYCAAHPVGAELPHLQSGVTCAPPGLNVMMPDPVLLIEILWPNNELWTRATMWIYSTIPSVGEILAIHSTRIEAELLRRQPDNNRPERPEIVSAAEPLMLSSIGFTVPLAAIYRTTALAGSA